MVIERSIYKTNKMKSRYTYQQHNSRLITIAFALLFSLSVFGSETEGPKSSKAGSADIEMETDVQVEDWMLNLDTWEISNNEYIAVEQELKIEDWMLSADAFTTEKVSLETEETESDMVIENWMTDLNQW